MKNEEKRKFYVHFSSPLSGTAKVGKEAYRAVMGEARKRRKKQLAGILKKFILLFYGKYGLYQVFTISK
jgi:hypothetical protein